MSRAVQFDSYGDIDVLRVCDVPRPAPAPDEVLVEVRAAGINPGEAMIRKGFLHDRWPAAFPSGEGSDLAGVVVETGSQVTGFAVGDEVLGYSLARSSHAQFVTVPADQLVAKPQSVPWEVAGSLYVAGTTAWAAVRSVRLGAGDVVAIAGASGGVGSIGVQLATRAGATVLGIAGPSNDDWLFEHGATPVNYGDGLSDRLRAASPTGRVDAMLDFFGDGYVALAVDELGVARERVDTVIDFAAAERYGVQVVGSAEATSAAVVGQLADLVARGELEVPIARVYPLEEVQAAFRDLEQRHTRGKVVLRP